MTALYASSASSNTRIVLDYCVQQTTAMSFFEDFGFVEYYTGMFRSLVASENDS